MKFRLEVGVRDRLVQLCPGLRPSGGTEGDGLFIARGCPFLKATTPTTVDINDEVKGDSDDGDGSDYSSLGSGGGGGSGGGSSSSGGGGGGGYRYDEHEGMQGPEAPDSFGGEQANVFVSFLR